MCHSICLYVCVCVFVCTESHMGRVLGCVKVYKKLRGAPIAIALFGYSADVALSL